MSAKLYKYKYTFIFGALFVALAFGIFLLGASHRPLWGDETYGFIGLGTPLATLLTSGANNQCSPSPFYYLVMDLWFFVFPGGQEHLVLARAPSALAGGLFLGLIVWVWKEAPFLAFVVAFCLLRDEIFINHVTEARPYLIWLALTFLAWLPLRKIIQHREGSGSYILLGTVALLLTMTSTGALFFLVGIGVYVLGWRRRALLRATLALLPAILLGGFYASQSTCVNFAQEDAFSFFSMFRTGDFTLAKQITKMVISPKAWIDIPFHFCFLLALLVVAKNRNEFVEEKRMLGASVLIFGLATILTVAALAIKNYYFVPRMFIFLLAFRAILLANIFSIAARFFSIKFSGRWMVVSRVTVIVYCVLCFFLALQVFPLNRILAGFVG